MSETHPTRGTYRHWKGAPYRVHGVARHSETGEFLVVYQPLYGHDGPRFAVRPLDNWNETIDRDGYQGPRFMAAALTPGEIAMWSHLPESELECIGRQLAEARETIKQLAGERKFFRYVVWQMANRTNRHAEVPAPDYQDDLDGYPVRLSLSTDGTEVWVIAERFDRIEMQKRMKDAAGVAQDTEPTMDPETALMRVRQYARELREEYAELEQDWRKEHERAVTAERQLEQLRAARTDHT